MQVARPQWKTKWVASAEELSSVAGLMGNEELLAVDTETVGWESGNERLCLVQIGLPRQQLVVLIDALAIEDLRAIEPVLTGKEQLKIAHNAAFEERQFARRGIKMRGIADTLEMARRLRPDLPNHTLRTCCRLILGLELSKEEQSSDWSVRPLRPEQLEYAALDAEVALQLYSALHELEQRLTVDAALDIPELMQQLTAAAAEKFRLTREIAMELAYLNLRYEMLRDTVKAKLVDGAPPYSGEHGKCSLARVKQTEINPQKVRQELPQLADQVIVEAVDRKRFDAIVKEHGIQKEMLERVTDITGYVNRLSLSPGEFE